VSRGQTEVRWNNLSPQWDKGSITIRGLRPGDELEFKVWDDDRLLPGMSQERNRESLGSCKLPLPAAGEKKDEWLQVEGAAEEVGDGEPPHLHVAVEVRSDAATGPMTEPNADAKTIAKLAAEDVPGNLSVDVKILAAKGLKNRDWMGKSDPYCELFVGGVSRGQTEVRWNNLSPQWDKGSITIRGLRPGDELEFKVWDDDRLLPGMSQERNRESLGSCKLPLPAAGEKKDEWLQVEGAAEEVGDGEPPHLHVAVEVRSDAATGPMTEPEADAKKIAKPAAEDVMAKAEQGVPSSPVSSAPTTPVPSGMHVPRATADRVLMRRGNKEFGRTALNPHVVLALKSRAAATCRFCGNSSMDGCFGRYCHWEIPGKRAEYKRVPRSAWA